MSDKKFPYYPQFISKKAKKERIIVHKKIQNKENLTVPLSCLFFKASDKEQ